MAVLAGDELVKVLVHLLLLCLGLPLLRSQARQSIFSSGLRVWVSRSIWHLFISVTGLGEGSRTLPGVEFCLGNWSRKES